MNTQTQRIIDKDNEIAAIFNFEHTVLADILNFDPEGFQIKEVEAVNTPFGDWDYAVTVYTQTGTDESYVGTFELYRDVVLQLIEH